MDSIEALIFDYGGTLDSRGTHWAHVIRRFSSEHGIHYTDGQFREAYIYAERYLDANPVIDPSFTFLDVMRAKISLELRHAGIDIPGKAEAIAASCYEFARTCTASAIPVLRQLASSYPLVLVSNFYGNLRSVLADFALIPLFTHIIDSTEVGVRKPDPAIFTLALNKLSLPARSTAVIGDSVKNDIIPARTLGCHTILLDGTGWEGNLSSADTRLTPSTHIIKAIEELPCLLKIN